MVIFMPYYRQHGQLFTSHSRPTSSSSNEQNNTTTNLDPMNGCKFASNIICRFTFSLFLLIIAIFLFRISISNEDGLSPNEGSTIIAAILLTVGIISFIRTCQKLRRYFIILDTRQRLIQRLRERQQAYDLAVTINNDDNPANITTDLPKYRDLFPSHLNISNNNNELPSYDDFVKTLVIHHSTTGLPVGSHTLSLPTASSQSSTNSTPCIWITDRTRRPLCIRGTVTYV